MSVTTTPTATTTTATATAAPAKSLIFGGLTAAALAAAATATLAAVGKAAGISLVVGGGPIPVSGFAVLTVIFSTVGLALALILTRTVHRPRTVFVRTTITLTALSLIPDLAADAAGATKMLLMSTHLLAAVIVIPAITRRLSA
ncbi:hypothetical protein GCM10027176_60170 [Actinoallomurus bryophytorum]|uniref:Uncharacterized protein n=1 Tax=Actinoallomurus bryophytorum TaxID=1490222 RepID=A0A543CQH9_9ACTN|nr:DUF6069 family protein [Actinoallomurus bryophytorum]TQL99364.1 hypothetical protein FB559_5043 [Actinoallomurus bryophytorum]